MRINSAAPAAGTANRSSARPPAWRGAVLSFILPLFSCVFGACTREAEVVVYTSVDQEFAQKILANFQRDTGIRVAAVYDSEAGKTTGLVRRLAREKDSPRCDVWWSGEIFGTIELARERVLIEYTSPEAAAIPIAWRDSENRWTALAARCRVLVYNRNRVQPGDLPTSWRDLSRHVRERRLALANPLFGTTRGHVAAMFAYWGDEPARAALRDFHEYKALLADGNAQSVALVAAGSADWGATDTDDALIAQGRGQPVELAYLPLDEGTPAVWIPCSVGLIRGAPHSDLGRKLVDYLVSAATERALAESDSRNVPVRDAIRTAIGYEGPTPTPLDFGRIADALAKADQAVSDILIR